MKHLSFVKSIGMDKMHPGFTLFLIVCVFHVCNGCLSGQSQKTDSDYIFNAAKQDISVKYSKILGIPEDSVCCISLYGVIDKWPVYILKNPSKRILSPDGIFIQYVYYLAYTTKLPANIDLLYNHNKTYRFKNLIFLRTGDLVFYDNVSEKPEKIAIYLQDNMLALVEPDGNLKFITLATLKETGMLIAAKIVKDEQGTSN